jgi:hypothetical protein
MEARVEYWPSSERPRLTVVKDDGGSARYSALPHAVLTDARTKHGHIVTYAVLQMHWWQGGECWASNAVLRAEVKCSDAQLRRYLKDLVAWGFITERRRGQGQGKAYAPAHAVPGDGRAVREPLADEQSNRSPVSGSEANRSPVTTEPLTGDSFNRSPVTHLSRRTEEDSLKEEDTGERVAADAAPEPAMKARPAKTSTAKKTPCPETFPLEEKHFQYAQSLGLDRNRTRAETDKFLAHHRFKGTVGQDWYAGWQNWLRRALQYDAPSRPHRNGTATQDGQPSKLPPKNVRTY